VSYKMKREMTSGSKSPRCFPLYVARRLGTTYSREGERKRERKGESEGKSVRGSPIEGRLRHGLVETFAEKARVSICRRVARSRSLVYDVTCGAYCFPLRPNRRGRAKVAAIPRAR